jgi:hypothetical protein
MASKRILFRISHRVGRKMRANKRYQNEIVNFCSVCKFAQDPKHLLRNRRCEHMSCVKCQPNGYCRLCQGGFDTLLLSTLPAFQSI